MALESLPFRDRVLHEMTRLDERKRARDPHWNRYFLGILCRDALPAIAEGLAAGMTEEEAYADAMTPTRETHAVARRLGLALDVNRGRWVLPSGMEV